MKKGTLKIRFIIGSELISGKVKTESVRWNNVNLKKVIKRALKYGVPFSVGVRGGMIIDNPSYMEVIIKTKDYWGGETDWSGTHKFMLSLDGIVVGKGRKIYNILSAPEARLFVKQDN